MVRPSQEGRARPLTDAQSISAGDGTIVGDDGVDIDPGSPGGVVEPPIANVVEVIADSSTWDGVLDFSVASIWDITLGANLTGMTFANPPASGLDAKMEVSYRQPPSGGPFTLDQPAAADWRDTDGTAGGAEPTMPTAPESVLVVTFDVRDGGTSYGGSDDSASSGNAEEDFVEHGAMGSTEDFDPADGDAHTGILDDDCTATIAAPAGDGPIQMEWWITGDGDGHELTIAATGGSVIGDTPPVSVDGETYRLLLDRIPGSTNDWIVNLVGGTTGVVGELDDLTDVDTSGVSDGNLLSYDLGSTTWVPVAAPSGSVPDGTDPGDLLVWNGSAWEVLPVGTDGQIIYADSGETLGLLWDDAPTGGGGGTDPITAMFGAPDTAYEFDSSSLSGWTNLGTPDVRNADTTVPGHLFIKDDDSGTAAMGIYRTAPSMPFTAICKVSPTLRANYNSAGLLLGSSDPSGGRSAIVYFGRSDGGGTLEVATFGKLNSRTSYDAVGVANYIYVAGGGYLALVANSSSSVDSFFSRDGYVWTQIGIGQNPAITVATIGLFMFSINSGGMAVAWDFLRLWNSALTFPYG